MKRLTLVRHADAQWKDASIADFDRPLNRRGTGEAMAIARRLMEEELIPDLLIASAARRAMQTAELLAREFGTSTRRIQRDEQLYLAQPEDLLQVIRNTGPRVQHLMVVGHNPGISGLVRLLCGDDYRTELGTGCACTLEFPDARTWLDIAPGTARSARFETPPPRLFGFLGA